VPTAFWVTCFVLLPVVGYSLYWIANRWARGTVYRNVTLEGIEDYLYALAQTAPHSVMIVTHVKTGKFVQYIMCKEQSDTKSCGIRFSLPRAPWSSDSFQSVIGVVEQQNMRYSVERTREQLDAQYEMLHLDCGMDIPKGAKLAEMVLLDVFGLRPYDRYEIRFYRAAGPSPKPDGASVPGSHAGRKHATTLERLAYGTGRMVGRIASLLRLRDTQG